MWTLCMQSLQCTDLKVHTLKSDIFGHIITPQLLWSVKQHLTYRCFYAAYTMAKYGMSMCALGMAEEFRDEGVAVNTLWPRTGW